MERNNLGRDSRRKVLEGTTLVELRKLSRGKVAGGYSMKKAELIDVLLAAEARDEPVEVIKIFNRLADAMSTKKTKHPGSKVVRAQAVSRRHRRNKIAKASRRANR